MIPKECKRLAEVDFPIAEVSKNAAREKSIRHGHPSTLHLWWARRPLAACRAILLSLLLPDPCDAKCPSEFKENAKKILQEHPHHPIGWKNKLDTDEGLKKVLLKYIANFSDWKRSKDIDYIKTTHKLIKTLYHEEPPLIVDPFAGGGAIPLEAVRLGCDTFSSDLNPVACLIQKVMLEDAQQYGVSLSDDLRRFGIKVKENAEKYLAEFYPIDSDGSKPIAYLWARTVRCESPNCGAEIPLMRSFWLCKKNSRKKALKYIVRRQKGVPPSFEFNIFEPTSGEDVTGPTVTRAKAKCLCCGTVLPPARVRAQIVDQRGGADVIL